MGNIEEADKWLAEKKFNSYGDPEGALNVDYYL